MILANIIEVLAKRCSLYEFEVHALLKEKVLRTKVRIKVNDVNDNIPVFKRYFELIKQNWSSNTALLAVDASDADTSSVISYGLVNPATYFRLNGSMLMTTSVRPSKSTQKVQITASDGLHSTTMTAIINFIEKRAKPTFNMGHTIFQLSECSPTPHIVGQIVIDGDGPFVYWSSTDSRFTIEKSTGYIIKRVSIDYEKTREFKLNVFARRNNDNQIETQITIKVQNCFEHGPTMVSPKVFPVSVGKSLTTPEFK